MRLIDISLVTSGRRATVDDIERTLDPSDPWYRQRHDGDQKVIAALCGEVRALTAELASRTNGHQGDGSDTT